MKKLTYVVGIFVAAGLVAQDKQAVKFAKTITTEDLKDHVTTLSSDEFEGRETGKKGQKLAAEYIANHFKELGLEGPVEGSYFQKFEWDESTILTSYFRKENEKKVVFEDFIYYSRSETAGEEYIKVKVADQEDTRTADYEGAYIAYVAEDLDVWKKRMEKAAEKGAKGFIVILASDDDFNAMMSRFDPRLDMGKRGDESEKTIIVNEDLASWMFGKKMEDLKGGDEIQIVFNADYLDKPLETENVLGLLKGTEKPGEVLVITAHYDHIGIIDGEIYNGADDDGSGTASVLEIAEAFVTAAEKKKGPKRSILFMTTTGEEKGLLGSKHYTDTDPVFPLENTVVNLNIDMIGRIDEKHADNPDYVYVIGADKLSQELHRLSENVNKTYTHLELDYTYNAEDDPNRFFYRSDHYNFAKNNIPVIFYFNGTHPDYHQPTDTVEKIDFETMQKRARLVFHTGWEIANREGRITVD